VSDERVQIWLEKKLAREARDNLLLAFAILAAAGLVLAFTFAVFYTTSFFVLWRFFRFHPGACWWFAFGGVVLLFFVNAFTDHEKLTEYEVESTDGGPVRVFFLPHIGLVSNLNPFSAANAEAYVKILAALVLTGPRLVSAAWHTFKRSGRLRHADVPMLAYVFTLLLSAGKRVSLAEILPQLGHCDPSEIFRQISEIDGVVFLNSPPPGISLTADLRAEFFEELKPAE
jgi:hypothetical protein